MTTQDQYLPPKAITEPRRKRKYEQNKNIRHETTIFTWFTLFLCFHDEFLKTFKVQHTHPEQRILMEKTANYGYSEHHNCKEARNGKYAECFSFHPRVLSTS
jgi:hypothetical protein